MSKAKKFFILLIAGSLVILAVSCNSSGGKTASEISAEQTLEAIYTEETAQAEADANAGLEIEAAQPTETPLLTPGEPPEPERTLKDTDSSIRAYENRAVSGDRFLDSLYERPFTSEEMIYQPDLDIYTVDFAHD